MNSMTVKTLSGDFITLSVSDEKEFENVFKKTYIKKRFRAFVKVVLMDSDEGKIMVVNVHKLLPFMEEYYEVSWNILSRNSNKHAVKILIEKIKGIDNDIELYDLLSKDTPESAIYIEELIKKHLDRNGGDNIDINFLNALASNTNTRVLELLFNFIEKFDNEKDVWYSVVKNNNPFAFKKILEKMDRDELFKNKFDFKQLCYCQNEEVIDFLIRHPNFIDYKILSANPYAIDFLLENKDKIDWENFSKNNHPKAVALLRENKDNINIYSLVSNECEEAIDLLEELVDIEKTDDRYVLSALYKRLIINPFGIDLISRIYEKDRHFHPLLWKNPGIFCEDNENIYM
jgi:hypothetical protein